jgi:hypothetical protein
MNTYTVAGYSYQAGHYVELGVVSAKTERGALIAARKKFDIDGFGYADFAVSKVVA